MNNKAEILKNAEILRAILICWFDLLFFNMFLFIFIYLKSINSLISLIDLQATTKFFYIALLLFTSYQFILTHIRVFKSGMEELKNKRENKPAPYKFTSKY